jgi:hypothetical protein
MSLLRRKNGSRADTTARMRERARQKASQAVPLAKSAGTAAVQGAGEAAALAKPHVRRARRWAAPRVEQTGKAVQEKVAPQVSAMMTKAARRLDPDRKPRRRTRITRGIFLLTAAAGASAVVILLRRQPPLPGTGGTGPADADTMHGTGDKSAPAADEATRVEVNGQVSAS